MGRDGFDRSKKWWITSLSSLHPLNCLHATDPHLISPEPNQDSSWKCAVESIAEFSQETTAHGVKFFFQGKKLSRVAFVIAWLAAIVYTFYTCYRGIVDYQSRPTGTKFEIITEDYVNVTFPTITLCNVNPVENDYIESIEGLGDIWDLLSEVGNDKYHDNSVEADDSSVTDRLEQFKDLPVMKMTYADILKNGGPADDAILACKIGEDDCSSHPLLKDHKVFSREVTNAGNCFKINAEGLLKVSIPGSLGAMTLLINTRSTQYRSGNLAEPSEGYKISFHDHLSDGQVQNRGFVLSPGFMYTIQLSNKLTKMLPIPYGLEDCVTSSSDPKYRRNVCQNECIAKYVQKKCGCVTYPNPGIEDGELCTMEQLFACGMQTYNSISRSMNIRSEECGHCLGSCEFETYDHTVSSSVISNKFIELMMSVAASTQEGVDEEAAEKSPTCSFAFRKICEKLLANTLERLKTNRVKENILFLKIVFPVIERQTINQVVAYGLSNLLGDIGGVMGLFLGASVFTILEFVDFFVRAVFAYGKHLSAKPGAPSKQEISSGV